MLFSNLDQSQVAYKVEDIEKSATKLGDKLAFNYMKITIKYLLYGN